MRTRSAHGGRHELGQNFLVHSPTIDRIAKLVARTDGAILEIGAGDGALTRALARLRRPLTAIEIDERRASALQRALPHVHVQRGDVLRHPLDLPVVVGNLPFHLTTPILRRLLSRTGWTEAVLLTQWEVARKRAGVGGGTMMTAQAAPWFAFALEGRVPARGFRPAPSVDGGVLTIRRRVEPLVPPARRREYEAFVRAVYTTPGENLGGILSRAGGGSRRTTRGMLASLGIPAAARPRDLAPQEWARLWDAVSTRR